MNQNPIQSYKPYASDDWLLSTPRHMRDRYAHQAARGWTPEEIAIFKERGHWVNGAFKDRQLTQVQEVVAEKVLTTAEAA